MRRLLFALATFGLLACGADTTEPTPLPEGPGLEIGPEVDELGKALFDPVAGPNAKEDSLAARKALPTSVDNANSAVWEVRNNWADTNTAEAKKAGMAWAANSGLSWDEKYSAWVQSMEKVDAHNYGETFTFTTPYGKTLPAPAIECAETALFLRATFASWYGLPFFVQAGSGGKRIYLGHFGFRDANGTWKNTPNFKTRYKDYSSQASTWESEGWPKDERLRTRKLGGSQDDYQPALFEGARAGAYFDEAFLNKRTGYFMIYLLSYFGSINLADPVNLFNLDPAAIRAGDPLVKRYAREGIGHVYVTKYVEHSDGKIHAELVSGSMPRRQPKWESANVSQNAFTDEHAGGHGTNYEDDAYASLGGGLKRWRTPIQRNGFWVNSVPTADQSAFIDASDKLAIANRIDRFQDLLGEVTPEKRREALLETIEAQRMHLQNYPASCSARERREAAFDKLYDLEQEAFGRRRIEIDAAYRTLADYVFTELFYTKSKTCCWNSSTANMYEIAMDLAHKSIENHTEMTCNMPPIFMNLDGYDIFRNHAESIDRGGQWVDWSEDESCPQRDVVDDTEAEHDWTPFCEVGHVILGQGEVEPPPPVSGDDAYEPNNTQSEAMALGLEDTPELSLCGDDEDWYAVQIAEAGEFTAFVDFTHAEGDLDAKMVDADGNELSSSALTADQEILKYTIQPGTYYIQVFPYDSRTEGDCQAYTLSIELE